MALAATALASGCGSSSEAQAATATGRRMPDEGEPHARTWMGFTSSTAIWGRDLDGVQRDLMRIADAVAGFEPVTMLEVDGEGTAIVTTTCATAACCCPPLPTRLPTGLRVTRCRRSTPHATWCRCASTPLQAAAASTAPRSGSLPQVVHEPGLAGGDGLRTPAWVVRDTSSNLTHNETFKRGIVQTSRPLESRPRDLHGQGRSDQHRDTCSPDRRILQAHSGLGRRRANLRRLCWRQKPGC